MSSITYTEARENLASVWDMTVATREPVVISRRGSESVVMLPIDEWEGLVDTAHLLRSPANAKRLLAALQRLQAGEGETLTLGELRSRFSKK
jgi:antitoxin YefM